MDLGCVRYILPNEFDVRALAGHFKITKKDNVTALTKLDDRDKEQAQIEIKVTTPLEAAKLMGELLP
jgi:hypothetical protein